MTLWKLCNDKILTEKKLDVMEEEEKLVFWEADDQNALEGIHAHRKTMKIKWNWDIWGSARLTGTYFLPLLCFIFSEKMIDGFLL